jgi:predicted amidohydrolase YtcJ
VAKEANFIMLDRNIFEIPATEISETKVLETYLKGKSVYEQ